MRIGLTGKLRIGHTGGGNPRAFLGVVLFSIRHVSACGGGASILVLLLLQYNALSMIPTSLKDYLQR